MNIPADGLAGLKQNWRTDIISGFIISLIALPLGLGIAMASGVPPLAGLIACVVGGALVSLISGSYLTINGPAAGLAVIVLMCVDGFRKMAPAGLTPEAVELFAYQCTLAVGVGCGIIQIFFGFIKAGVLSNFFPSSVVHGMLAAIGIMIFAKQFHTALGVKPEGKEMINIILSIPHSIANMNPEVAIIALVSFVILLGLPMIKNKYVKMLPAPLIVILVAIPLGHYFDLEHEHKYLFLDNHAYNLGPKFLVSLPNHVIDGIIFPRFDYLFTSFGIQMMITYALVASLESLLTAAAIDNLDPYRRKSNFNRELFAKGIGNMFSSSIGGLPIIAEVVRSSANIVNGAKTRWSNFFHGIFLLIFIVFLGTVIHQIPLSALAAILMTVGYRLASPKEFVKTLRLGKEQLLIFVTTIFFTIAIDLLVGIAAGIIMKLIIHTINGVPIKSLFKPFLTINQIDELTYIIDVQHSAIFSNYLGLKKQLEALPKGKNITLDFTNVKLLDSSVQEHLHELSRTYTEGGGQFKITGTEGMKSLSSHEFSVKKRVIKNSYTNHEG